MHGYPEEQWTHVRLEEAGFVPGRLAEIKTQLAGEGRYRIIIVRHGAVVAEWNQGVTATTQLQLASASKSVYSCMLAIAVDEGVIPSVDAPVIDFYPEMMDVPPGTGPKEGRHAFPKDRAITFRQLISNTSGYMKPGEEPGRVFHYQTYGMNILTHAIATAYGLYDSRNPVSSPGFAQLVDSRLRLPMAGTWGYYVMNFPLQPDARLNIFGNYDGIQCTALDMARLGWLWCNWGRWGEKQLVPADWLREATRSAPAIRAHSPQEQWCYGYGFWVNDHGKLWPDLPHDCFAASGAGSRHIWVWPDQELVVVQSPGLWQDQAENNDGLLRNIVDALA